MIFGSENDETTRDCRKCDNNELTTLYDNENILSNIKTNRTWWKVMYSDQKIANLLKQYSLRDQMSEN